MSRRMFAAVVVCVCLLCHASQAWAWLYIIPADSLGDPLAGLAGSWGAADETHQRPIRGYMVNSSGYYYFVGESVDLNRFLGRADQAAASDKVRSWFHSVSRRLVVHPGPGYARVPGTTGDTTDERAQWKLGLVRSSDLAPNGRDVIRSLRVEVHVWLDEKVCLEELTVPATFEVASGGEIERFVREHSPAAAP